MTFPVKQPFAIFTEANGTPLENGYLYFGVANANPETTPITVYWDSAGLIPAAQPIRTEGGYPSRQGSPGQIYVPSDYSLTVRNRNGVFIYSQPVSTELQLIAGALGSAAGADQIGYTEGAAVAGAAQTGLTVAAILRERIRVQAYTGVVPDFDPATGVGTNCRPGIQAALTYAASKPRGAVVEFGNGPMLIGAGYSNFATPSGNVTNAKLLLGSGTVAKAANNIDLEGFGSTLYMGDTGVMLDLANAFNVRIHGLRALGYAGGALGASREFDSLIGIILSSQHVLIEDSYLSNCMGWIISSLADPQTAGGGVAALVYDIQILNNTLKGRYGNGVASPAGGSSTQRCFQGIDNQDVKISGNTIYGTVGIEPNSNGQRVIGFDVGNNSFRAGFVTPIVPAGVADYWRDEVLNVFGGGSKIFGGAYIAGVAALPIVGDNIIHDNNIQYGQIVGNTEPYYIDIMNNRFNQGKILLGTPAVNCRFFRCEGNVAYQTSDAANGFILLQGPTSACSITDNQLTNENFPVVKSTTGDERGGVVLADNKSWSYLASDAVQVTQVGTNLSLRKNNVSGNAAMEGAAANLFVNKSGIIPISTTVTATLTAGAGGAAVAFLLIVGGETEGGLGHSRAVWLIGGKMSDGTFSATEISRVNSGANFVISAINTAVAGQVTFTMQDASAVQQAQYSIAIIGCSGLGATPKIAVA